MEQLNNGGTRVVRHFLIKIPQHVIMSGCSEAEISVHCKLKLCLTCHKVMWGNGGIEPFILKADTRWGERSASLHGPFMAGETARVTYLTCGWMKKHHAFAWNLTRFCRLYNYYPCHTMKDVLTHGALCF